MTESKPNFIEIFPLRTPRLFKYTPIVAVLTDSSNECIHVEDSILIANSKPKPQSRSNNVLSSFLPRFFATDFSQNPKPYTRQTKIDTLNGEQSMRMPTPVSPPSSLVGVPTIQSRSNNVLPILLEHLRFDTAFSHSDEVAVNHPARVRKPCHTQLDRCFIQYKNRIGKYIRSCWKPTRTSPVVTETAIAQHTQSRPPPQIIDVHKETIKIQTNPPIYIRFGELKLAFGKYQNVDRIRNPDTMRKNRYNVVNVAYYLQLMVLLLEGLDEMSALSATDINVIMMKTQMLLFVNYEPNLWLQSTVSQWRAISRQIRDELLYILDDIFDEIGEG